METTREIRDSLIESLYENFESLSAQMQYSFVTQGRACKSFQSCKKHMDSIRKLLNALEEFEPPYN